MRTLACGVLNQSKCSNKKAQLDDFADKFDELVQFLKAIKFYRNTVSTFRTMMESYATFNNIFVEPKSEEEEEFRFLLWKLDGLFDKEKFDIGENDFPEAKELLEKKEIKKY